MKPYGSKICLIRPCTCCSPTKRAMKLTANRGRERHKAKEEIKDAVSDTIKRGKKEVL